LDTATARVKYSVADIEYTREHFASNPNQVIVTKISGSKPGSVSFTVSLDSKMSHHSYVKGENQIIIEGSCPGNRYAQKLNENDSPQGIQFTAILDLQVSEARGLVRVSEDSKLRVEGSDWAVLLLVSSSSFDGPFTKPIDSKKNPTSDSLSVLKSIGNLSYVDLYAHHLDDYQSLFHRVSLQLSKSSKNVSGNASLTRKEHMPFKSDISLKGSEDYTVSTAERVKAFQTDEDPSLVELLFQYGRYLLISCSRPGTQVANLQGIWNKDLTPPWEYVQHSSLYIFFWLHNNYNFLLLDLHFLHCIYISENVLSIPPKKRVKENKQDSFLLFCLSYCTPDSFLFFFGEKAWASIAFLHVSLTT
jgi:alpha-L-fucosidase 2